MMARLLILLSVMMASCSDSRGRSDAGPIDGRAADDAGYGECMSDFVCSDGVSCTVDRCAGGRCVRTPDDRLCGSGASCDLGEGCVTRTACARPIDCLDEDPCTTNERCDEATRTCRFEVLDGDGDGDPPVVCGGGDCDDSDRLVSSRQRELCDGRDNNCNGARDDGTDLCYDPSLVCRSGSCECMDASQRPCELGCVDVQANPRHCGACYRDCGSNPCVGGTCQCSGGQTFCDLDGCVDTLTDRYNCGACDRTCAPTSVCRGGDCAPCGAVGQTCCEGLCTTGAACIGDVCQACGDLDQICCAGDQCRAVDTSCVSGRCIVPDRGACDDPLPRLAASQLPRCSSATLTCALACTTNACITGCLAADTTPALGGVTCNGCVNYAVNWCGDSMGCHAEWADYVCCSEARCPSGGSTCVNSMCAAEITAFVDCANALPRTCFLIASGEPRRCFP